jgi:sulfide:quinone oxidoreductase
LKRVVVVGSGAGGTLTANLLAHALRREIRHGEVSVELLGESLYHPFQPANLDVAFKGASPSKFVRTEEELLRDEVRFIHDRVSLIDMNERQVTTETGRILKYDYLVLATGAVADPSLIPGLEKGALNFHTGPQDSQKIWETLQTFKGGKVVVAIAGTPHKCPPSPNEAAFMLDEFFRARGIRDNTDIRFLTPYPRAYPAEKISRVIAPLFEKRKIEVTPFFNVDSVDPGLRKIYSMEGEEFEYDLLIAVPPHRGADVIVKSGIGDSEGWIPANRGTMVLKGHDDAFAIGDATAIPISKSGVVAHLQSIVVADNVLSDMSGSSERLEYNGRINCPMEVGDHRAIFVSSTFTTPPVDQTPSLVKYMEKRAFSRIYWRALNGSLEPIFDVFFGKTRMPVEEVKEPEKITPVPRAS